ncbi:protein draper-like [Microplitis demolitor]|uniref:protein draper-like n=1 Tax=Microplitis demolitor TaxID=69319 RepID=UPI00235B5F8B|nr:protein draper-like [Microplitis demolitor]XP_014297220.2 protein draper-like [Microplitis demolitor]
MMITFLLLIFTLTEASIFKLLNETIEEKVPIHECADYGNRCNRFLRKPCCEKDNICRRMGWGASNDLYMCVKQSKLNEDCQYNLDCLQVDYTECYDHKCQCLPNYIAAGTTACLPLVGQLCSKDGYCGSPNSACVDSKCQCNKNYVSNSNNECVPTPLGKFCRNNDECADIIHAKCSKDKICVCRDKYVEVNGNTCSPLLGEFCWRNELCAANNSICADNECQCKKNYVPISNNECRESSIGWSCNSHYDCKSIHRQTKCSLDNKCVCESDFLASDGVTCLQALGDYCFNDNQCGPRFSTCRSNICQCNFPSELKSYGKCIEN